MRIKTLNHYYGDKKILNNINVTLESKGFISILGPNGSGKTTFIKKLLRHLQVSKDTILLNGEDILSYKLKDYAKKIASVAQENNYSYNFTVEEVISMGRNPYIKKFIGETKKDFDIVNDILKDLELEDFRERSFLELSGGEKQRVVIGRALAQEPEILILDEPINHLDIKYKIKLLNLIKKLSIEKDITIIIILHDLNFALNYSNFCFLLKNGEVFKEGIPEEVLTKRTIREVYELDTEIIKYNSNESMIVFKQ